MAPRSRPVIPRLSPEAEWALRALFQAALSSIPDLVGWNRYDERTCRAVVKELEQIGYIVAEKIGNTMPAINRYRATELGHRYWRNYFSDETIPWGNDEKEYALLKERLPMAEQTYRSLPSFIGDGGANELTAFRLLRSSSIHAVAEYDTDYWVMFIWAGLWADWATMAQKWQYRFRSLTHTNLAAIYDQSTGVSGVDLSARPSAVAVIAIDEWAAQVAVDVLTPHVGQSKLRVFTADHVLSRDFVLRPTPDSLTERPRASNRRPKAPAAAPSPPLIDNKPAFDVAITAEEWPGARVSQIADLLGERTGNVRPIVERLMGNAPADRKGTVVPANRQAHSGQVAPAPALISEFGGRYFMSEDGLDHAAGRDRIRPEKARGRFAHYLPEESKSRGHYSRHDSRVISMAAKMKRSGLPVAAGWRACWNEPDLTQIDPDFVVRFGAARVAGATFPPLWWFGEYEKESATPAAIVDKMSTFFKLNDLLREQGRERFGILLICDDENVERLFWRIGRGLLLFTATYDRVMQGPLVGDSTVLKMYGLPASVSLPSGNSLISWTGKHGPQLAR